MPDAAPHALARLAAFVAGTIPAPDAATLGTVRDAVIDTLGCIHAGRHTAVAANARKAVAAMGGTGPASVLATGLMVSRPQAAFLNAVAAHALDFDDCEIPGNTHPTAVMLPALLAAAEGPVAGGRLAEAYIAGFEVIARLGEALNYEHYARGWHATATLGTLGAAAAVARLLALDEMRTVHALSIATSAATGFTCQFGSDAKPLQAGFAARAGLEAALLARAGATGQPHVLSHPNGFAALTGGLDQERLEAALSRLGGPLALAQHGIVLKPWPTCGYTHRVMTCALELHDRVAVDAIARVEIRLPDLHAKVLPFHAPSSRAQALFSLPFVAAMGLARGGLTLEHLEGPIWREADIAALIAHTRLHPYAPLRPDLNYAPEDPDQLEIVMRDGRRLRTQCVYPRGAPQAPMESHALRSKLVANMGGGGPARIETLLGWLDAADATALLTAERAPPAVVA